MERIENEEFWDYYWETRLLGLQNLGKVEAILAGSKQIRRLSPLLGRPLRLLELGCGEGQIIGPLVEAHDRVCTAAACTGVDYLRASLRNARRDYPALNFVEGDFTDPALLKKLGSFEIVMMVNALHEVFSAGYSDLLGEVDVPTAKQQVKSAFSDAARCLSPGGVFILFDGLETSGDLQEQIRIRFLHRQAFEHFETYAREYRPFRVTYRTLDPRDTVELSRRDFTRYLTKSIFLGKALWETERLESYQYFNEQEFRAVFAQEGLEIEELRTLTVDDEKWRHTIEIMTPGVEFPEEHILIIAKKAVGL